MERVFFGIEPPKEVVEVLQGLCHGVPNARWLDPESYHITILFLGEQRESEIEKLVSALHWFEFSEFEVELQSVGYFPAEGRPNVLYAGVENWEELKELNQKLRSLVHSKTSIQCERRKLHPHLTLARLKKSPFNRILQWVQLRSSFSTEAFPVQEFHLYKSHLGAKGAHYEKILTVALR